MRLVILYASLALLCSATAVAHGPVMSSGPDAGSRPMNMAVAGSAGVAETPIDSRQSIPLSNSETAMLLADMRKMLASEEGVINGLARGDMKAVAAAASESGMNMTRSLPPALRKKFPPPFMQMGIATHRIFDQIAAQSRTDRTPAPILELLAEGTRYCVACHASYRLGSER